MNKSLIICDRVLYGALLVLIFYLPYSLAMISGLEIVMFALWLCRRVLLARAALPQGWPDCLDLKPSSLLWPFLALTALIVLTMPFSHSFFLTFKKLFTRFLFQFLLMAVVIDVVRSPRRLYGVLGVIMFMVFFVGLEALWQYFLVRHPADNTPLLFGRVSGPMHHPNDLGTLLVTVVPAAMVLAFTVRRWRLVFVAVVLVLISTLVLTASRGAWMAFALSMVVFSLAFKRRRIIAAILVILAMLFWLFGMYVLSKRIDIYDRPMTHAPLMQPSLNNPWGLPGQYHAWTMLSNLSGREMYWDTARDVIKQRPWFGCGYNAYIPTLKDMQVGHTEYPHNSLLHITAELGITGLLFYVWLLAALCGQGFKVLKAVAADQSYYCLGFGLGCGILAWLIHSLVDTPWSSLPLGILLWLFIGVLMSLPTVKKAGYDRTHQCCDHS